MRAVIRNFAYPVMKKLFLLLPLAVLLMSAGQITDFDQAKSEAVKDHKFILLTFTGSDWCGPCRAMHRNVFDQDTFRQFAASHLVMIEADFPHDKSKIERDTRRFNRSLAAKYQKTLTYPYTVLLDADGKVLQTWRGYGGQPAQDYIEDMNVILSTTGNTAAAGF